MDTLAEPVVSPAVVSFDNSYARELAGFYVAQRPAIVRAPRLLYFNAPLADELRLDLSRLDDQSKASLFAGNTVPEGAEPIAQVYAGHQFGGFSPRLGDGRALLLGEVIDRNCRRRDIAFKGSGRTPFARGGDGKAAIGPMLREVLISEAMHALRIPTTRALAVAATGEQVLREDILPGAVLTRVAASHIRVGTFQFFAARGDVEAVRKLADYTIARHDPDVAATEKPYLGLLRNAAQRQAALIAHWMNVGFIHGVMNTDNMAISGETIDYGPCAFMEAYDPATVFSSIDDQGRYAFGNQPDIACWNLARFAETLLPLLSDDRDEAIALATDVVAELFPSSYRSCLLNGQRAKLGLVPTERDDDAADRALIDAWLALLHAERVDFTLAWRRLGDAAIEDEAPLRALFTNHDAASAWLSRWRTRCERDDVAEGVKPASMQRAERMRNVNPIVIPRNHLVEEALEAASREGNLGPFMELLAAVQQPFVELPARARYAEPAPASVTACYRTFCGT